MKDPNQVIHDITEAIHAVLPDDYLFTCAILKNGDGDSLRLSGNVDDSELDRFLSMVLNRIENKDYKIVKDEDFQSDSSSKES